MLKFNQIISFLLAILFTLGFVFSDVRANLGVDQKDLFQLKYNELLLPFNMSLDNQTVPLSNKTAIDMLDLFTDSTIKTVKIGKRVHKDTKEWAKIFNEKALKSTTTKIDKTIEKIRNTTKYNLFRHSKKVKSVSQNNKIFRVKFKTKTKSVVRKTTTQWLPRSKTLTKIYKNALRHNKISEKALRQAFDFYEKNRRTKDLKNKYITIVDYTQISRKKRLYLVNLRDGSIASYYVSHAKKSGPYGGRVLSTSNKVGSNKTSKGFFKVGYREGITATKKYDYLTVRGLEKSNRKVGWPTRLGGRDIILHTAKYANKGGRSEGCFVIRPKDKKAVFSRIKGSLLYSYTG